MLWIACRGPRLVLRMCFLPAVVSVVAMLGLPTAESVSAEPDEAPLLKVGFAEADITPELGMEAPGGYGKSYHRSVHDPCKVRVAVFDDGQKRVALVGVDALAVHNEMVANCRAQIEQRCGIPGDAVLIGASHSHSSGPAFGVRPGQYDHASELVQELAYERSTNANPEYIAHITKQIVDSVCKANEQRVDARCGVGSGHEDQVAFNRRFRMANGLTFTHPRQNNPDILEVAGPIDPEVGVIGVWDSDGELLGCVVNYACHATASPGGISANWIYYMEQAIQGMMGKDAVVVYLQGASGDVTQVDNLSPYVRRRGEEDSRFVGGRVGAEAVKVLLSMRPGPMGPIDFRRKTFEVACRVPSPERLKQSLELVQKDPKEVGRTEWTFAKEIVLLDAKLAKNGTSREVEVQAVQVGPAVFITNEAEYFCQMGLQIKNRSPFPFTFPVTLANGCCGYVPTEEAFSEHGGGYETRLTGYSHLVPSAGPQMVEVGVELANQMKPGKVPTAPPAPPFSGDGWSYGSVPPELE